MTNSIFTKKKTLYVVLAAIFITNALVAELIGGKIFSLEKSLDLAPLNWEIWTDMFLSFNMTAGVILWPFVFITTDVINEYFGMEGVKKITWITVGCIAYAFLMIFIAIQLTPADFWLGIYGDTIDIDLAFKLVLGQGLNIIVASLIAFFIGQLIDAYIFDFIRTKTGNKMVWLRATGSTIISQLLDSFVVLFIAFYVLANKPWPFSTVIAVGIINFIYKFFIAVLFTPLIYLAHHFIDRYLGSEKYHSRSYED